MWKRKRKQKVEEAVEDKSPIEEGQANEAVKVELITEQQARDVDKDAPSTEEKQAGDEVVKKETPPEEKQDKEISEETPSAKEQQLSKTIKEAPPVEEKSPSGVFVFGKKVENSFKKFIISLFSIFIFPPLILFGLAIMTCVGLIAYPFILLALCMLLIAMPVVLPFITLIVLITGKGKVHFGLKNKKLALKILGLTFPPNADRQ